LIAKVALGEQKVEISEEGSRESSTGRNDLKKVRPGEADAGIVAREPSWTVALIVVAADILEGAASK